MNVYNNINKYLLAIYCSSVFCGMLFIINSEKLAYKFEWKVAFSPYLIFFSVLAIFLVLLLVLCFDILKKTQSHKEYVLLFALLSSYETISYGCGTSGGLAEGQATLGLATGIALFLKYTNFRCGLLPRTLIVLLCIYVSLQCIDRKLIHTYYWWESNESNYWQSNLKTDIPLMEGIQVSEETKTLYEGIYHAIEDNTTEMDRIYCFPRIPIFYALTNRMDPGVMSKVQWFDVSSEKTLDKDIDILKNNLPKAIVVYDTSDAVCLAHEQLFRGNKESWTRKMRDELLNLTDEFYVCHAVYKANANVVSVYIRRDT
jgi:hypothetical protein